jgi:hypothetical protein
MKKGSETKIIKRSQINLNPCNPKVHTDADIKQQKANIKKVGLIGGIQWNETTGNLIDGHKRVMSVDLIQGYDGTPETDYDIKVEAVDFDEKTEKEQLLFMAKSQDPIDYNLVAKNFSIDEIDFKAAGFTEQDTEQIKMLQDDLEASLKESGMDDFSEDFLNEPMASVAEPVPMTELPNIEKTSEEIVAEHAAKTKMTKEEVKEQKQHCTDVGMKRQEDIDNFIFIDFESLEQKQLFCDMLHMVATSSMRVSGSQVLGLL